MTGKAGKAGSLTIVGTGIRLHRQTTPEAAAELAAADRVLFLVADALVGAWLVGLRPGAESLSSCFEEGVSRRAAYDLVVERLLEPVRRGERVCAAFYGHPGFFAVPAHRAVARARREGFEATMLPGISSVDCLWADLGVDPGHGCQIYDATDLVDRSRIFDPQVSLLLFQTSLLGGRTFSRSPPRGGAKLLADCLQPHYPEDHQVVLYEAACYPIEEARIERLPLRLLSEAEVRPQTTVYVPPVAVAR